MFTLDDIRLLIIATDALIISEGETPELMDLNNRLSEERDRLSTNGPTACGFELEDGGVAYYGV